MTTFFIIPCGAAKTAEANPAADLYTGSAFRMALAAAQDEAAATARDLGTEARVLILSALHGLVEPTTVLAPYDVKMGDAASIAPEAIAAQAPALGLVDGDEVYAMLPKAYRKVLTEALADVAPVFDVYEASPGIGYQRGTCATLSRTADLVLA